MRRRGFDPTWIRCVDEFHGYAGCARTFGGIAWTRHMGAGCGASRNNTVTRGPVQLDFGACGKGYLVDLLGRMLRSTQFVIDAGGDLLIHAEQPISIALEDPEDSSRAIGVAHIVNGALCASAPSRRHWNVAVNERTQIAIHHLLNAIDGLPRNKPKPAGHTFQQTQRSILHATTPPPSRTAWPQPCSFPTQRNCSARSISHTQH